MAVKFHLYAPKRPDGGRDDALEKKLGHLEDWYGTSIWNSVCNDFPDLAYEPLRKMLALLVATTYLRNPAQFERTKSLHRLMVGLFSQHNSPPETVEIKGKVYQVDQSDWPAFRDATEEDLKRNWNEEVSQAGWLAERLLKMRWAVIVSDEPAFITSDNPVMLIHPSLKFCGLNDPETVVIFPLSPTRILSMDHRCGEPDARFYPIKHNPASVNGLVLRNAVEHIFSPRHPDSVCAEILADAECTGFPANSA